VLHELLKYRFAPNPFSAKARRVYRFCVPEEWYRRSRSRNVSRESAGPSESTLRRLASLQESEESEEDEDDGTAKGASSQTQKGTTKEMTKAVEEQGLVTSRRLSSMFDGWLYSSQPSSSSAPDRSSIVSVAEKRKSVSEPKLLDQALNSNKHEAGDGKDGDSDLESRFEEMMVSAPFSSNNIV